MEKINLESLSVLELLNCYADVLNELKKRRVVRTRNSPVADFAEWIVANKLNLQLEPNSTQGYDATNSKNARFQIKGRRLTTENASRQLGVIRNLESREFDFLIGVVFDSDFTVKEAYKIPHIIIGKYAKFSQAQNGHILHLRGEVLEDPKTVDITNSLL